MLGHHVLGHSCHLSCDSQAVLRVPAVPQKNVLKRRHTTSRKPAQAHHFERRRRPTGSIPKEIRCQPSPATNHLGTEHGSCFLSVPRKTNQIGNMSYRFLSKSQQPSCPESLLGLTQGVPAFWSRHQVRLAQVLAVTTAL